ncbi:MAG TPA: hypothetical protein VJ821_13525 [Anaerolineales bacterium]|nr:hypothetical protein [Anaerolineales bacterium]
MNKLFKTLSFLAVIALFATACIPAVVNVAQAAPVEADYQAVLGKPVSDNSVVNFIASNRCFAASQFHLCQDAGMALWIGPNEKVNTVYLYAAGANGFVAYKGELPFGIDASDSMADVEQKLGQPKVEHAPQAGWEPGLPDAGSSPDHLRYWAVYERFRVTIVYNTPFANDKDASIHAILVNQ